METGSKARAMDEEQARAAVQAAELRWLEEQRQRFSMTRAYSTAFGAHPSIDGPR